MFSIHISFIRFGELEKWPRSGHSNHKDFDESFERGEDPMADTADTIDASDINFVAGVLKLYLRELIVPLFPKCYFESTHAHESCLIIIIRYLLAFADENVIDSYNLAINFIPAPEDNQEQCQNQINELIKNKIIGHDDVIKDKILLH
uniref:Rho-GAP domain-containing protein n=1 Tax=Glossina palpalis gambiensis TaxID=67801 RepID=A0A1B0C0V9_9MUSC